MLREKPANNSPANSESLPPQSSRQVEKQPLAMAEGKVLGRTHVAVMSEHQHLLNGWPLGRPDTPQPLPG